jgi:hypothetical protein
MARRSTAAASLWFLALIACVSAATGAADVAASGASRDDGSDVGSIDALDAIGDATRAGPVAVVFVTSRDAESLSACRAGLLRALRASVADLPDHDVFVLHGGNGTGPMTGRGEPDDADGDKLPPATMLSQSALKPLVPERLQCDCSSGNGGTPFAFMAWLASDAQNVLGEATKDAEASVVGYASRVEAKKKEYAFAWYVEEDVVFTGNWADVFRLRTVSTPESRVREVEVFGELSPASVLKRGLNDDADADGGGDDDKDKNDEKSFASAPVDVVAHVERVVSSWKKRCRMPGDGSVHQANGTGCVGVDGFVHRTWWPVIGISKRFARSLITSIAHPDGANGHQEPLTMSFCRLMNAKKADETQKANRNRNASNAGLNDTSFERQSDDASGETSCAFRVLPTSALGEYQLGHWGRFVGRPKSHPTFTAPGLTYGHNLLFDRLYHPLKCEADAGIGALAAACAVSDKREGSLRVDAKSVRGEEDLEKKDEDSAFSSRAPPRRALAGDDSGGGGGGGGGIDATPHALTPLTRALRETYFEKKPWALEFDDGGYGGGVNETAYGHSDWATRRGLSRLERDAVAYADAMAAAFERNEATRSRALAAARPYARPVRGPKKKTSVSSSGG